MTRHRSPSLFQSFNHATEGIVHAVRTQRNLWIHFAVAVAVLVAAVGFGATELPLVASTVTVIIVIAVKAYTGRGTPLRGGLPSGHAAVAFAGWMAVTLILDASAHRFLISSVTFIMAMLVAQTRVETGVHSASEVASGGVLGALVTLFLFQAFA